MSVNHIPFSHSAQSLAKPETRRIMDFLCNTISDIFKKTDKTIQPTEIAKKLFRSKKETIQETEEAILESTCGSFFDKKNAYNFCVVFRQISRKPNRRGPCLH